MKAFQETHKARDALQACLDIEDELLNEVADRVQHSLQSSLQAAQVVAAKLQVDDFEREQRHTEVLLRCGLLLLCSVLQTAPSCLVCFLQPSNTPHWLGV